jgi:hypothetical protein
MLRIHSIAVIVVTACGGGSSGISDATSGDTARDDTGTFDAPTTSALGTVDGVTDLPTCPMGAPPAATCKRVTVSGCPGIESEALDATLAIVPETSTLRGTIVHFSGGGGTGFQTGGLQAYRAAGFRQVFVAWTNDWEQTQSAGIKTAGCRPSTLLKWIFDDPALHGGSRTNAFCGEGFSGGSAQLGYALAQYGLGAYLDYVNELSGPPFARIDLGCDGDAPATGLVCGTATTMRLPSKLDGWENIKPPASCGGTGIAAAELARWKADSIAVGGVYEHPQTRVEFFDCTNQSTAVTAMAQIYYDQMAASTGGAQFHCYSQADGCMGEGLGSGAQAAIQAMITGCVPRH